MAKIIITIEDTFDNKVGVVSNPSFEEMIKQHAAKDGLQPSHGYALCALNAIRIAAKEGAPFKTFVNRIKGIK